MKPFTDAAGRLVAVQTPEVQRVITFAFVGLEVVTGLVCAGLLLFFDVEKGLPKKQAEIRARNEAKQTGGPEIC